MECISWNDLSMLIDQYHKDAEEYIHRVCREGMSESIEYEYRELLCVGMP